MRRTVAVGAGLVLLIGGMFLTLYGLFAILYEGDEGGGDTDVTIGGREIDADIAGAIALIVALLAVSLAAWLFRRRASRVAKSS